MRSATACSEGSKESLVVDWPDGGPRERATRCASSISIYDTQAPIRKLARGSITDQEHFLYTYCVSYIGLHLGCAWEMDEADDAAFVKVISSDVDENVAHEYFTALRDAEPVLLAAFAS